MLWNLNDFADKIDIGRITGCWRCNVIYITSKVSPAYAYAYVVMKTRLIVLYISHLYRFSNFNRSSHFFSMPMVMAFIVAYLFFTDYCQNLILAMYFCIIHKFWLLTSHISASPYVFWCISGHILMTTNSLDISVSPWESYYIWMIGKMELFSEIELLTHWPQKRLMVFQSAERKMFLCSIKF